MRDSAVEFKHGKLQNGKIDHTFRVTAVAGTYEPGEVLVASVDTTTKAVTWAKATAVDITKPHVVCAEEAVLTTADEIVVYQGGYFNSAFVKVNGEVVTENDAEALKAIGIIVEDVAEQ